MIMVIIAGGSGSRLWPLSTPDYPKHLLQVNDDNLSLLQHAYQRASQLTDQIYVVSEASHIQHVKEQLTDLPDEAFIVEPGRRGTANCIIAALAHISRRHPKDEPVAFIHSDHYIRDVGGFVQSFHSAEKVSQAQKRIVLIGVEPTGPATKFGYIEKGGLLAGQDVVSDVKSFKEKPDYETAKRYFDSGNYLWNGGYFVASPAVFLDNMKRSAPELAEHYRQLVEASPEDYERLYLSFEAQAIDYALIEKVPDLLVVPAAFDWLDLGSFSDLHRAAGGDEQGNYLRGPVKVDDVTNSYIRNEEDKPVAVIGLDNVAVINTPDGILVTRKDLDQKVGDISKQLAQ